MWCGINVFIYGCINNLGLGQLYGLRLTEVQKKVSCMVEILHYTSTYVLSPLRIKQKNSNFTLLQFSFLYIDASLSLSTFFDSL